MKNEKLMLFGIADLISSFFLLIPKELYNNLVGFRGTLWAGLIICGIVLVIIGYFKKI